MDGDLPGPIREDESFWTLGMSRHPTFFFRFVYLYSRVMPLHLAYSLRWLPYFGFTTLNLEKSERRNG